MSESFNIEISEPLPTSRAKRLIKLRKCSKMVCRIFSDYCDHATVDGIQYLTQRKRHWTERAFWALVLLVSFYFGGQAVHDTWIFWQEFPVIVTFSERMMPISNIPFPAITICPQLKFDPELFNFTDAYKKFKECEDNSDYESCNVTETELHRFKTVLQTCVIPLHETFNLSTTPKTDVIETLTELNYPKILSEFYALWAVETFINGHFKLSLTDAGVCITFNLFDCNDLLQPNSTFEFYNFTTGNPKKQWSLESGYEKKSGLAAYPLRVFGTGTQNGLQIFFMTKTEYLDYICGGPTPGYIVKLHPAYELPNMNQGSFRIPLDQEITAEIHPSATRTSPSLRSYAPKARQCYFSDERFLKYFKVYSPNNCEKECVANFTLKKCGCVPFYMPVSLGTKICDFDSIDCYKEAETLVHLHEFQEILDDEGEMEEHDHISCDCLPSCNSLSYTAAVTQSVLRFQDMFLAIGDISDEIKEFHVSKIQLSFGDANIHMYKRSELYGTTEFIADCGGLLGLFLGVSVVSVVEIIYFCTLRLVCNKKSRPNSIIALN